MGARLRPLALLALAAACAAPPVADEPRDDEIVVCGERFGTGTRVVLWTEPEGYHGGPHYGTRPGDPTTLDDLRRIVRQVIVHYDVAGTSRRCHEVLQRRKLSCHFLLDLDGTIYQTLDLKERAWHAGKANDRSVGIEIANIGAYRTSQKLDRWYVIDQEGPRVALPPNIGRGRLPDSFVARPARRELIRGRIHGTLLVQYDYTLEQYEALGKLLAALNRALPRIRLDAPRDLAGQVRTTVLAPEEQETFAGVLGHYHLTKGKIDPGPAFDWERVLAR